MSSPRYEPRSYLQESARGDFGRFPARVLPWVPKPGRGRTVVDGRAVFDDVEVVRWRAARMQNDLVNRIQGQILLDRHAVSRIAQAGGFSVERLRKVLRGEAILRLEDLAAISVATGLEVRLQLRDGLAEAVAIDL